MEQFVADTLKDHNLRTTTCRTEVLGTFLNKEVALSHGDLEGALGDQFDRVTIYRTLKTFLEKGIIHKVLDDEGVRYALCKDRCTEHDHHHDHIHFKCTNCGQTNCLENVHIPAVQLPDGYRANELNLLIQGRCPECVA
ncbi:transcriptional repressor [Rhabdobacter roseus]|uniref:Fur family ferric uptake transcriptional regulator n=1 Tax=Rhabdobacter roseus TaxID=1655419 RepID=A0A840TXF3_9BACT|nr:transcriptional repressor [Rhabdobacter roseus]MBB5284329.1 Fur family ferric uptake transcriptional regulator [Rhabdobacter roseus]